MRLLAEENTDAEWIRALSEGGHDIVRVADVTRSGGEIRNGVRRLEKAEFDLSGRVVFLSDWL